MIEGFIVNKFRGDPALFARGMRADRRAHRLAARSASCRIFAAAHRLPAEDALALDERPRERIGRTRDRRARLSAHRQFRRFRSAAAGAERRSAIRVAPGEPMPGDAALVILPGSKATIADLAALRSAGWDIDLAAHIRRGGQRARHLRRLSDARPRRSPIRMGIEGPPADGRQASAFSTSRRCSAATRSLARSAATACRTATPFNGYEMHVGRTSGADCARPLVALCRRPQRRRGQCADGRVLGCYVHGLFADDRQRAQWLEKLGGDASALNYEADVDATLDALARHLERHLDCDAILALAAVPAFTA